MTQMRFNGLGQDLRFALRTARRSPGFAVAAAAILAVAIGANTAIFSIVSGVLWRPLPFPHAEDLMELQHLNVRTGPGPVFYQDLEDWRARARDFAGMAVYGVASRNLLDVPDPERIPTTWGERRLFDVLGARPLLGRTFRTDDPPETVVLSAALWRRRFAADSALLGRTISLDGVPHTVIGIMPDGFQFPYGSPAAEIWIPWRMEPGVNRSRRVDHVVARVRQGVPMERARRELEGLAARLADTYSENRGRGVLMRPLSDVIVGGARPALLSLVGAVGFVLLIACANVSNLLLARAARRTQEMSVRAALGATRARLLRQLLTESLLLSLTAGIGGIAVAAAATRLILRAAADQIPRSSDIALDWRVFAFLLAVSAATGLIFGIFPGLAAARANAQGALVKSTRTSTGGGRWLRDSLVVAEVALSFVLLVSAVLLLRSFIQLLETPVGLAADRVLTLRLTVALKEYPEPGAYGRYLARLEERVAQAPGVRSVGFIQYLPLENWGWFAYFTIPGRNQPASTELRYVSPGYFQAMGIPLRRGRFFTAHDTPQAERVILVNGALARTYFPGEDPVGRKTDRGVIVGVVGDVRAAKLNMPAKPELYYAFAQNTAATSQAGVALIVRTAGAPESFAGVVRDAIHEVNPRQVLFGIKSMERVIGDSVSDRRLYVWLIGVFAALALALSLSGVYAVISFLVAARTREFGIRMALGADAAEIARLVVGRGSALAGIGIAIGAVGSTAASKVLSALGDVQRPDAATLLASAAALGIAAMAACAGPARRAIRVDVNAALRDE